MKYTCYKEAYDALVKDNGGVLPDLHEAVDITISGSLCNLVIMHTVADVVAHALIEMSASKTAKRSNPQIKTEQLYLSATGSEPLHLDNLLGQAIVSNN